MRVPGTSAPISSTAFARTAVLPIPGSPTTVRAPPWPCAAASARATRVPTTAAAAGQGLVVVRRAQQEGGSRERVRTRGIPDVGHPSASAGYRRGLDTRRDVKEYRWALEPDWPRSEIAGRTIGGWSISSARASTCSTSSPPAEELRTAVPGLRTAADGESPVLVGITDRRVLVVGRWRADASDRHGPRTGVSVVDATPHVAGLARAASIEMETGDTISFDLDDHTMDRLWAAMDGLAGVTGVG